MTKKTKKVEVEEPQVQEAVAETAPVVEQPEVKKVKTKVKRVDGWEIKDRIYYLANDRSPLSYTLKTSNLYWFDENVNYERELKYTSNQKTVFVDEMVGDQRLEHVVFRNGSLHVPKNKQTLQKLLSLYHMRHPVFFSRLVCILISL